MLFRSNTIAQMIVQSAATSAAQDEARMQREQDLAYRREQMGLERERLAQQGRESDARVANVKTETEARQFDLKRAKSKDADFAPGVVAASQQHLAICERELGAELNATVATAPRKALEG